MNTDQLENNFNLMRESLFLYAPRVLGAILVLVLGLWFTQRLANMVTKMMMKRGLDVSLQSFFASLINVALKVLVLITVAGMLGIQTTSFVAILGAAGLAVGLALQGSLSNFAGGVLILAFKPYKVGDLIESGGEFGEVKEIQIFNTILLSPDNKTIIIPNGAVSSAKIINYSEHGSIRINITVQLPADVNVAKVKEVITNNVLNTNPLILKSPAHSVNISDYKDGMLFTTIHAYCIAAQYWDAFYSLNEQISQALMSNGINLPMPHHVEIVKEMK